MSHPQKEEAHERELTGFDTNLAGPHFKPSATPAQAFDWTVTAPPDEASVVVFKAPLLPVAALMIDGHEVSPNQQVDVFPAPANPGFYGCSEAGWETMAQLVGSEYLLPTVCDPHQWNARGFQLKDGKIQRVLGSGFGKTPSAVNTSGKLHGFKNWQIKVPADWELKQWAQNRDLGILVRTNRARALDIDSGNPETVAAILEVVARHLGPDRWSHTPIRWRDNSARKTLLFIVEEPVSKQTVSLRPELRDPSAKKEEAYELLGDGQQTLWGGTHPSGARLQHSQLNAARGLPVVTLAELQLLWSELANKFAQDVVKAATLEKGHGAALVLASNSDDPVAQYLFEQGHARGSDRGKVHVDCPWQEHHESSKGTTPVGGASWLLAGVDADGKTMHGRFKCMHAGCKAHGSGRLVNETNDRGLTERFLEAVGFRDAEIAAAFPAMPAPPALPPSVFRGFEGFAGLGSVPAKTEGGSKLTFAKNQNFEASRSNLTIALSEGKFGVQIALDEFKGEEMISTDGVAWRPLKNTDYHDMIVGLERARFNPIQKEHMRDTVEAVANNNRFDSAQQWLGALEWDGVPRINSFLANAFGAEDTEYHTAVSRYLWSGLAGRVIKPGEKCDMMLIAVSKQGGAKTSAIRNIAPLEEFVGTMDLNTPVNDRCRLMKGKVLMELGEMTGFSKKDANELKMFLSETVDEWVEKFQIKSTRKPRRCMFFGTSNNQDLLTDPTGNRRYLPFLAAVLQECNPEWVKANRDQLWAEAAVLYKTSGIQYAVAETLGAEVHAEFTSADPLAERIASWIDQPWSFDGKRPADREYLTTTVVMAEALQMRPVDMTKAFSMRVAAILRDLEWAHKKVRVGDKTLWGYVKADKA